MVELGNVILLSALPSEVKYQEPMSLKQGVMLVKLVYCNKFRLCEQQRSVIYIGYQIRYQNDKFKLKSKSNPNLRADGSRVLKRTHSTNWAEFKMSVLKTAHCCS